VHKGLVVFGLLLFCVGMAGLMVPRLSMLPTWVSPTGFSDPDNAWTDEVNAYDGDTATYAYSTVPALSWGSFIYLTIPSTLGNKLRYWVTEFGGLFGQGNIDIDVLKDGVWTDVYTGAYKPYDEWIEESFSQGTVTQIRVRFENVRTDPDTVKLAEISLWQVLEEQPPQEQPPPEEQPQSWAFPLIAVGLTFTICGVIVPSKRKS